MDQEKRDELRRPLHAWAELNRDVDPEITADCEAILAHIEALEASLDRCSERRNFWMQEAKKQGDTVARAIAEAVAQEREACHRIARMMQLPRDLPKNDVSRAQGFVEGCKAVADGIRARNGGYNKQPSAPTASPSPTKSAT